MRVGGAAKGALPGSIVLDAGEHAVDLVRRGSPEAFLSARVQLKAGQRLDLRTLLVPEGAGDAEVTLSMGGQGFLAADAREQVFTPGPLLRLELAWPDAFAPGWTLAGDVGVGAHDASLTPGGAPLRARHRALVGGLGVYRDWRIGALSGLQLRAGPRLEAVSLERRLSGAQGFQDTEGVFSLGFGGGMGVAWPILGDFFAVLDGRLSFVYLRVDEETRNLTNAAAFGGVRVRL